MRLWRRCLYTSDTHLQDCALGLLLLFPGEQRSSCGMLEYLPDTLVGLRRALEVLLGTNLLADILGLESLVR